MDSDTAKELETLRKRLSRAAAKPPGSGGGSSLTVEEQDGTPTVANVNTIKVSNGTLTDDGGGIVSLSITGGGGNITSTGAAGSEPGSPSAGDLYLPNNGFVIERYSGSAWAPWGPIFPLTTPPASGWAWINQGSASVDTTKGAVILTDPANSTSASNKIYKRTAPATPYTITALIMPNFVAIDFMNGGLCFRQSSDGKLILFKHDYVDSSGKTFGLSIVTASSATAEVANLKSVRLGGIGGPLWLRIEDNGTNRKYYYSRDGQTFVQFYSEARTTYLTADEVGVYIDSRNATHAATMTVPSWG